jgi:hypothetical protein
MMSNQADFPIESEPCRAIGPSDNGERRAAWACRAAVSMHASPENRLPKTLPTANCQT